MDLIDDLIDRAETWLIRHPRTTAILSAACLVDMANCIKLGHGDWFIPAMAATYLAYLVGGR
jgi:hypothetical protein